MKKLHFLNIKGSELNREEMRHIIAGGSGGGCGDKCHGADANCTGDVCYRCGGGGPVGVNSTCR